MTTELRSADSAVAPVHRKRSTCRACDSSDLRRFLALGDQPLANAFLRDPAEFAVERFFPLDVYLCEQCSLVQLLDVIDPEVLFGEYIYVTGTSETIAAHNEAYARGVVELLGLKPGDLVVELASNDGSLLERFRARGVRVLGVEPARNIARMAQQRGIETVNRFFDGAAARDLRRDHGPARAVVGNNVLAHVDDTRDFLSGARQLIDGHGLVIVEVPYAWDMHERLEYDTIYHEHLCYFTVTSLARVGEAVGLSVTRVDRVPVHGGSIRVCFARDGQHGAQPLAMMAAERERGLTQGAAWDDFARGAERNRREVRDVLQGIRSRGESVAGYGAPAKGNTLLNYCGVDTSLLPWTVDRNPLKVGRFTPGMHLPTRPVAALLDERPDCVFILAWNFAEEIVRQLASYQAGGGRFIVPIPTPRVL